MAANTYSVDKENGGVVEHSDEGDKPLIVQSYEQGTKLKVIMDTEPVGKKYDNGKLDWTLFPWVILEDFIELFGEENLPWDAIEGVIKVQTFGINKYGRDNWMQVLEGVRRYGAASWRHKKKLYGDKEELDSETGLPHKYHVWCNNVFVRYLKKMEEK